MQNLKTLSAIGALVIGSMSSTMAAAQTGAASPPSSSRTGAVSEFGSTGYIGGSVGRSDFDLGGCLALSCDDKGTGFKLYTGGRFSRYMGAELGYVNLGEADRNGGHVKAQGANLSLVGYLPVTDKFNVLGRVGAVYGWTDTSTPIAGVPSGDDNGFGLSYGAGLQYDINTAVALRADWDRYRLKYAAARENADLYSVGLVVKF